MAKLFKGETIHTQENIEAGGGSIPAGIYRRGPNGTLIRCSGAYIKQGNSFVFDENGRPTLKTVWYARPYMVGRPRHNAMATRMNLHALPQVLDY